MIKLNSVIGSMAVFNDLPIDVVKLIIIRYPVLGFVNKRYLQIIKKEGIKIPVRDIIQSTGLIDWFLEKRTFLESKFVKIALKKAKPDVLHRLLTIYQKRGEVNKGIHKMHRSTRWSKFIYEKTNEWSCGSLFIQMLKSRSLENIKHADSFGIRPKVNEENIFESHISEFIGTFATPDIFNFYRDHLEIDVCVYSALWHNIALAEWIVFKSGLAFDVSNLYCAVARAVEDGHCEIIIELINRGCDVRLGMLETSCPKLHNWLLTNYHKYKHNIVPIHIVSFKDYIISAGFGYVLDSE